MQGMVFNKLGGASIKSIQRIMYSTSAIAATDTAITISSVNMSKTFLWVQELTYTDSPAGAPAGGNHYSVQLKTSTSLEINAGSNFAAFNAPYRPRYLIFVIEFSSGVTVQRGVITGSSASITAVDTTKSVISVQSWGDTSTTLPTPVPYGVFSSSTAISISGGMYNKYYEVIILT